MFLTLTWWAVSEEADFTSWELILSAQVLKSLFLTDFKESFSEYQVLFCQLKHKYQRGCVTEIYLLIAFSKI